MRVRVVTRDNGAGLTRDMHVVRDVLTDAGHEVTCLGLPGGKGVVALRQWDLRLRRARVDVQVFLERVHPRLMPLAARNVLVPNPEWFPDAWRRWVPRFDAVLCKTHHAVPLFAAHGASAQHVGFTGVDRLERGVAPVDGVLHVAGRSSAKGTQSVIAAWHRHPEWPRLTVVQSASKAVAHVHAPNIDHRIGHIDDGELRRLQNAHRLHMQPSEMEGFGHVLVEAMSVGAVVITTDGAPMSELVTPGRGVLVTPSGTTRKDLATRYRVEPDAVEAAMAQAFALTPTHRLALGAAAREWFLSHDAAFRARLPDAVAG